MGKFLGLVLLVLAALTAGAENASLAQIDASRLLLSQEVDLYISVTDSAGAPVPGLTEDAFRVAESVTGRGFREITDIRAFTPQPGTNEGITFVLLIDNSGSMYDALNGKPTKTASAMRVTHAKDAVRRFLASVTSPLDRIGLASYNTSYQSLARPGRDPERLAGLLDGIRKPEPEQAYTELYASLTLAARDFAGVRGRKAIIILSDGENYPYALHAGKPHPQFKERVFAHTESIRACQEEGISVYAIRFGPEKDRNLRGIALETGGQVFDAADREELTGIYRRIHAQVAGEYRLTYRGGMEPAEQKYVRVRVEGREGRAEATRFYFASTVFGLPLPGLGWWLLLPPLLAGVLVWLATRLRLESRPGQPRLQVLQTRVGSASTRALPLGSAKTVIGGSRQADLTIAGAPGVREQHATVVYDPKTRSYTIVGEVTVNNRPVKNRRLEAGDVIDVGGATIVFDDGEV